jgi:hypothetical protein
VLSTSKLTPIAAAATRLGRSSWTLKRWYRAGILPVVSAQGQMSVPESFLIAVEMSPQPGRAGVLEDIAAEWFAANSAAAQVPA